MKKKVLMVASNATAFNGFCGMINGICKYIPGYEFQFTVFWQSCKNTDELIRKHGLIDRNDVQFIDFEKEFKSAYHSKRSLIYNHIGYSVSIGKYLRYKDRVRQIGEVKGNVWNWFDSNKPDVVLLYGDRMLGAEVIVANVAKMRGIPSIAATIGYSLSSLTKAGHRKKDYEVRSLALFDNFVFSKCPTLFFEEEGKKYRFCDTVEMLAGFENQCMSVNPWYNGAGDAQFVTIRDRAQYDDLKYGITEDLFRAKAVLTGDIEERDIISGYIEREQIIERFKMEYGIKGKKIVIIAVPRYAGYDRFQYPYDRYMDNVDKMIQTLGGVGNNETDLLLSIHPKDKLGDYLVFEKKYGCSIIKEPLKEYIGIAHMYIHEELSSTRYWGNLLKIPTYAIPKDFSGRDYAEDDFWALREFYEHNVRESVPDKRDVRNTGEIDFYDFFTKVLAGG